MDFGAASAFRIVAVKCCEALRRICSLLACSTIRRVVAPSRVSDKEGLGDDESSDVADVRLANPAKLVDLGARGLHFGTRSSANVRSSAVSGAASDADALEARPFSSALEAYGLIRSEAVLTSLGVV